jgi:RNA polymerase sigma-70 factor (ECF subfamily)
VSPIEARPALFAAVEEDEAEAEIQRLYRETAAYLHSTLRRLTWRGADVDDMLQDVFVIALGRPEALLGASSSKAWLWGIAVRVAAARRRRHRVRVLLGLDKVPALVAVRGGPLQALEQREAEAQVTAALECLSAKKREVLVLFELDGLTGNEIAEALGCPLKTVWTRLFHARRELAAALEKNERGQP